MRLSSKRFNEFYDRVKGNFPYNDVRVTRRCFHVKWLLMTCKTDPGIQFYHGHLFPLLCSTVHANVVQELIITGQGLPLPQDFSLLLDSMFYWGRAINVAWYEKTLELINFYLHCEDLSRETFTSSRLYFDVIQMRVLQIINNHFTYGNHVVVEGWMDHFKEMTASGTTSFFDLAVLSIQYTNTKVHEMLVSDESEGDISDVPDNVKSVP